MVASNILSSQCISLLENKKEKKKEEKALCKCKSLGAFVMARFCKVLHRPALLRKVFAYLPILLLNKPFCYLGNWRESGNKASFI